MNRIFPVFCVLIPCLTLADQIKPRYYVALGTTLPLNFGDLDGSGYMSAEDSIGTETTWIPDIPATPIFSGAIGSQLNAHDVALLLAYGSIRSNSDIGKTDANLLNIAFSYAYQFRWPEPLRPRISASWQYTRFSLDRIAYHEPDNGDSPTWGGAVLSGSGPGIGGGVGWYVGRHVAVVLDTRVRYYWWKSIATDQFGLSELDKALTGVCWETAFEARWVF